MEMLRLLRGLAALTTFASVALLGAVLAPAEAADQPVVVGPWTITAAFQSGDKGASFAAKKWHLAFGDACSAGAACQVQGSTGLGESDSMSLATGADGFQITQHFDLECHDTVTGETTTTHGADYDLTATLTATKVEEVDGTSYVTELTGTMVEAVVINARGRAEDCTTPSGGFEEHARSTLTGTADALPAPSAGAPSEPVGLGPSSTGTAANGSGTIAGFTLPLGSEAERSVAAVDAGRRSSFPGAVVVPSESLSTVVDRLPQDLLLVGILALLIVFPAQVFNSTYEENHERVERTFGRLRRRRAPPAEEQPAAGPGRVRRIVVFLVSVVLGTLLGGLLDPNFGADRPTTALLVGVFVALLVAVGVAVGSGWLFRSVRHLSRDWYLRAIPSGLVVGIVCVLVSRLTHFAPGYLYGVLGGAVFAGALARRTEGGAETVTMLGGLVVALGAWVAFEPVAHAANSAHPSLGVLVADSFLAALFVGGIEGMLFSLIPLRFLPGHRVKQWGWVPWALLTVLTAYVFVHVLLTPASGYLGRSTAATTNLTIALFAGFGVFSMGFWAWFRFRPDKPEERGPEPGPPQEGLERVPASEPVVAS
ncbi:MAG TPA: FGLLP motif-containing membrane protein [Nocardioides sp.]|uniref:FGLLP motif-containing membrane protein n=1 Tax=Nocardioides sp. TaxID=35761 RepID=UPI002E2FDE08|nr:FGLLP motif-containing membrane protein [Nocardioides sp.]HEX5088481.1 FGLLP motif-containing membrane protein [Nocardioides sp.]